MVFPKYVKNGGMAVYVIVLIVVTMLFYDYSMPAVFVAFGLFEVILFFQFSSSLSSSLQKVSEESFSRRIFVTALGLRAAYVVFTYFLYLYMTDSEFEFNAADSMFYHSMAQWFSYSIREGEELLPYFESFGEGISDVGYPTYLGVVYLLSFDSVIVARLLKAFWSAYTCVLIYRLAKRNFGDDVARLAAVMCVCMPNMIFYCGVHLKETEMLFLAVLYVERVDYIINTRTFSPLVIISVVLLMGSMFFFRTALGGVAVLSLLTAIVFSANKVMGWKKKIMIGSWVALSLLFFAKNKISNELESMMNTDVTSMQDNNMQWRAERKGGNSFAVYAGKSVFAPMIFTIPFPTLVDVGGQEIQMMINGGNFCKNITSFFSIFALFSMAFWKKNWRQHVMLLAFMCGYLAVIAQSSFAHSERFHFPALPFALIVAAYGMSLASSKVHKYFNVWLCVMFVAILAWAWFKLAGRGMI